jgi:hypothetical protein
MMGKGKDLGFPEGRGGGKGEPGVPPIYKVKSHSKNAQQHINCYF